MALEQERRVAVRGLNLGADPVQLAEGALTVADGVRYLELGAAHSRGGRKRCPLEFPDEGIDAATSYVQSYAHFRSVGGQPVRGIAPYYDTRLWTLSSTGNPTERIPIRLNFLYKAGTSLYFNDETPTGAPLFRSPNTKARIIVYGDQAYIADASTPPKVFRKLPMTSQSFLERVQYTTMRMGIIWPTAGTTDVADLVQKPVAIKAPLAPALEIGTYRFRIVLENLYGRQSGPSMPVEVTTVAGDGSIVVSWSTIVSTFPAGVNYVRLYVQVTLAGTAAESPSAYCYVNRAPIAAANIVFNRGVYNDLANRPLMRTGNGAPPTLTDICIVNDIAYGASATDVIYREVIETDIATVTGNPGDNGPGTGREVPTGGGMPNRRRSQQFTKLTTKTSIKPVPVNESYFFVSDPGEPEYMETMYQLGNGSEIIVGLAPLGTNCVIFTNQRIYVYDPETESIRTVPASIGCISRDAITPTERGIRFVATDGIPRLFNGALVEEVADELLPIFDRDDYVGPYLPFDKANGQEITGTYGDRKFFMSYPVSQAGNLFKPGQDISTGGARDLVVGDESRGPTLWSIDRNAGYETVQWMGRESRLLAIDGSGYFYFIEEGLVDENPAPYADTAPYFEIATRRFTQGGLMAQFYAAALDTNTVGQSVTLECTVDGDEDLKQTFVVATGRRDEYKTPLPSWFKGRYLDTRYYGNATGGRVALYGIIVESARRGEFS